MQFQTARYTDLQSYRTGIVSHGEDSESKTDPNFDVQTGWSASELAERAASVVLSDPETAARLAAEAEEVSRMIAVGSDLPLLAEVATAIARQEPDMAENAAMSIADVELRARTLANVAMHMETSDPVRRKRVLRAAERAAGLIAQEPKQAGVLVSIAAAAAILDVDRAEAIADGITDSHTRANALVAVVRAAAPRDPLRAEATMKKIAQTNERKEALLALVVSLAKIDPAHAERLIDEVDRPAASGTDDPPAQVLSNDLTDRAILSLAGAISNTDPERAGLLLSRVDPSLLSQWNLAALVSIYYRLHIGDTEATLNRISDPAARDGALLGLVSHVAPVSPDHAHAYAMRISGRDHRAVALADVAISLRTADPVRCGSIIEQVMTLIRDISDPRSTARTSGWIAEKFRRHFPSESRRALAVALASTAFESSLGTLAEIEPGAALAICKQTLLGLGAMVPDREV